MHGPRSRLLAYGVCALLMGACVYIVARPPHTAAFLPEAMSLHVPLPAGVVALAGVLPVFFHTLGFCILLAVVLRPGRRGAYVVCLGWLLVEVLFEVGQHPQVRSVLFSARGGAAPVDGVRSWMGAYFHQGTFDPFDLLTATLGAGAAGVFLRRLPPRSVPHEHPG